MWFFNDKVHIKDNGMQKDSKNNFNDIHDSGVYSGGDGLNIENAVVINAATSFEGIRSEYEYIAMRHGIKGQDWNLEMQALMNYEGKNIDLLSIKTSQGDEFSYYFYISNFYGTTLSNCILNNH
jgi:hypothetical protein